jgi:hypothetical protein
MVRNYIAKENVSIRISQRKDLFSTPDQVTYLVTSGHRRVHKPQASICLVPLEALPHELRDRVTGLAVPGILGQGDLAGCADEGAVEGESGDAVAGVPRRDEERAGHAGRAFVLASLG